LIHGLAKRVENCSDFKFAASADQPMYYFLILLVLITAPLMAQTGAPAGAASPAPTIPVTPATDATPPPIAEPAPAEPQASPSPGANPTPSPAAGEDVIPLPPESGTAEKPMVSDTEVPKNAKPSPGEPLSDSTFADPNAVIPGDAGTGAAPAGSGPSAQEIARKLKTRYQEVRIQVEKDPAVRSLMEQSKAAKSFEDERAALREYYRLLFKKIKKADKDLTAHCDRLEQAYLARLAQTRIEPTIPLNPPPTPAPLSE
jgi:hypothetical protein